ncbi:CaiB/BaiF CoA transferase family protein [Paenibacillus prosopidis]|uniref:Formyl-CoA transferase/succinate--hydroxymethylglutarate CoA-transferase n=1 Tax=Paenibacillus prosopidis TaxID=630520 RepID=A0A368VMX7_9BACL|nr:CoA transferase [Paenibacillus prosopidis]RCW42355.1 formyl-CoA transferase/succinate--hydroxymethylglutarate CoA-transferase [Paenibacillus prosopidis]
MGPLSGIKVVEIAHWLVAPYCTNMLSDLGAEVIKIEPLSGDQVRSSGSYFKDGESYLFAAYNHGKRSISLNLKDPEGLIIAHDLCRTADVIVENYRPGTCDKLGVGYEQIKEINPNVIYCSISAFGETQGYAHLPGMDPILQGMGAVMSVTGEAGGDPLLVGVPVADTSTAYLAFGAICAALLERERSGTGQRVLLNLIDSMVFNLSTRFGQYTASGQSPLPMGNQHAEVVPYQAFPTKDGWLMAGAQSDQAWLVFCKAIGSPELAEHEDFQSNQLRLKNRERLSEQLNLIFSNKTTKEWCSILSENSVLHGPIWNVEQLVDSDLIRDHHMIVNVEHPVFGTLPVLRTPIRYSQSEVEVQSPPPLLGEHTVDILQQLGYGYDVIEKLTKNKIVYAHTAIHAGHRVSGLTGGGKP